jgi:SNW domain-containing protein 1
LLPKQVTEEDPSLLRPDEETVKEVTERTRKALEALVSAKVDAAMPVREAEKKGPDQYVRYTPSNQMEEFNSGASQRIIRMVEVQRDPMSPPRFKINTKIPKGPPSPPAPVLHSPTRKVTVKEQQEWKIPPCISNWKNPKGYTIPLDKRLAADGRGLQGVHIGENFSKLAEALYIADRKAREAIEMRAKMEKTIAEKEKSKKEDELKRLADEVRMHRSGIKPIREDKDLKEREDIRKEQERARRRETAIQRAAPEKRTQLQKMKDRDVSEMIALGMPNTKAGGGEVQFDTRLFNTTKGMDSGFGDDEAYTVYDKPWRDTESVANAVYKPSKNIDKDYGDELEKSLKTKRFVPDKGFEGVDRSGGGRGDGPVAFESDFDPFQINKIFDTLKGDKKRDASGDDASKKKRKI